MTAEAAQGKEKLKQYITDTLAKLNNSPPPAAVLKEKASPAVAGTLKTMLAGAPASVTDQVKSILIAAGILPNHTANLTDFKTALKSILDLVDNMGGGKPVSAPEAAVKEVIEEVDAPVEAEEEGGDEEGDFDPLAMIGGMGEEIPYETNLIPEAAPQEATPAAAAPGEGKKKFIEYITTTLSKLEEKCPEPAELKGRVMPMVVKSIKGFVDGAPPAVSNEVKKILTQHKVLPNFVADIKGLKAALSALQDFVSK